MPRFRWLTYRVVEAKGGGGIGVGDVPSGKDGDSRPLDWRVRRSLATETMSVRGWKRKTRTARKKKNTGE